MTPNPDQSIESRCVHAGIGRYSHRPVIPPIFQTSTFAFDDADQGARIFEGREPGYIYTRVGNPTVSALEDCVAALEGGTQSIACASGMAAVHTSLAGLLKAGDHVVCSDAVYGPTCTLVGEFLAKFGVASTMVDTSDTATVRAAIRPNTTVVFIESPGNPTLVVTDLQAVCAIAHEHGATVIVDNTFMSPILQRPFEHGADVVIHSMTKFLNGHADVIAGMIVVKDADLGAAYRNAVLHFGGVMSPFEAFLVHRGIKTLPLRVREQSKNALTIAKHLEAHEAVEWVRYPGLPSHPGYAVSQRQSLGGGAVISFGLRDGLEAGKAMMNAVKVCELAVSLGGVETLIEHPASMTHASMGREARERAHITDGLVRLSVGIEGVDDLIADLDQALECTMSTDERRGQCNRGDALPTRPRDHAHAH